MTDEIAPLEGPPAHPSAGLDPNGVGSVYCDDRGRYHWNGDEKVYENPAAQGGNDSETDDTGLADLLRQRLLDVDALKALPPPVPLIEGVLMRDTLAVLWGRPGGGKSFVALDWAMSIGTGSWWLGREVAKGLVVYVAAEGSAGLYQRAEAWMKGRGVHQVTSEQVVWLPGAVNLLEPRWTDALAEMCRELRPALIVIDTLARSLVGGDENGSRDMGLAVDAANKIQRASRAAVLFVHHDRKDGSVMRGSSALYGAADTSIELKSVDRSMTMRCEKQKDAAPFEDIALALEVVELPADGVGQPRSSCLPVPKMAWDNSEELGASEERLMGHLWDCAGTTGLTATDLLGISEMAKSTFYRTLNALVRRRVVLNVGTDKRPRYSPVGEQPTSSVPPSPKQSQVGLDPVSPTPPLFRGAGNGTTGHPEASNEASEDRVQLGASS